MVSNRRKRSLFIWNFYLFTFVVRVKKDLDFEEEEKISRNIKGKKCDIKNIKEIFRKKNNFLG